MTKFKNKREKFIKWKQSIIRHINYRLIGVQNINSSDVLDSEIYLERLIKVFHNAVILYLIVEFGSYEPEHVKIVLSIKVVINDITISNSGNISHILSLITISLLPTIDNHID